MEVLINQHINPIPKSAAYVVGVINFRGEVITVVDTSIKFGIVDYKVDVKRIIIVIGLNINNKQVKLGCLCDAVHRMETLATDEILQVPDFGTYYQPELLNGVFYLNKELYAIINIEKIFSTDELLVVLKN